MNKQTFKFTLKTASLCLGCGLLSVGIRHQQIQQQRVLDQHFEMLNKKIDERFDRLDKSIADGFDQLNKKIDKMNTNLTDIINHQSKRE